MHLIKLWETTLLNTFLTLHPHQDFLFFHYCISRSLSSVVNKEVLKSHGENNRTYTYYSTDKKRIKLEEAYKNSSVAAITLLTGGVRALSLPTVRINSFPLFCLCSGFCIECLTVFLRQGFPHSAKKDRDSPGSKESLITIWHNLVNGQWLINCMYGQVYITSDDS